MIPYECCGWLLICTPWERDYVIGIKSSCSAFQMHPCVLQHPPSTRVHLQHWHLQRMGGQVSSFVMLRCVGCGQLYLG